MKIRTKDLISHIEKARVGGVLNELALSENLKFFATNDVRSVLTINDIGIDDIDVGQIGLFDLDLVIRTIQYVSTSLFQNDEFLDFTIENNRLVFRKGDNEFKFLLCKPSVISSTVPEYKAILSKIRSVEGISIVLSSEIISNLFKAIQLIEPKNIEIYTKDGKLFCQVGEQNEHNVIIFLGTSDKQVTAKFNATSINKVLATLPVESLINVEIRSDCPIIFTSGNYLFLVTPITKGD